MLKLRIRFWHMLAEFAESHLKKTHAKFQQSKLQKDQRVANFWLRAVFNWAGNYHYLKFLSEMPHEFKDKLEDQGFYMFTHLEHLKRQARRYGIMYYKDNWQLLQDMEDRKRASSSSRLQIWGIWIPVVITLFVSSREEFAEAIAWLRSLF